MRPIRIAVLTVSDGVAAGTREDTSGAAIERWIAESGYQAVGRVAVPDAQDRIVAALCAFADAADGDGVDVVLTTGGTGMTARDVTPEATRTVLDRDVPGLVEAMRQRGAAATPFAWLSRGVAGTRGRTLIVNLPGSQGGVRDGLDVLDTLLPHAVQLLRGVDTDRHEPIA